MANPEFKNLNYKNIEFDYVHLSAPRVWDNTNRKFITVEPDHPHGKYTLTWTISNDDGKKFVDTCFAHFNARKPENSKITTDFGAVHGLKILDNGLYQVTASRNTLNQFGKRNPLVEIIDEYGLDVENRQIMGGSRGTVAFSAYPSSNPSSGKWGISLGLLKVQLLERGAGSHDDGVFDIKPKSEMDDVFGLKPVPKRAKPTVPTPAPATPIEDVFDDDIPF